MSVPIQNKRPGKQPRTFHIIANWKSNPASLKDLDRLQKAYMGLRVPDGVRLVVCPSPIHQLIEAGKSIYIGAQDVQVAAIGTGSWSAEMLQSCGVSYCIVGHSERRSLGEQDIDVKKKTIQLIEAGIVPIVCIGESFRDDNGKYINIIKHQLQVVSKGMSLAQAGRMIIAYEPVWAIGRGARACTAVECYEVVQVIREEMSRLIPGLSVTDVVVLYGGSVDSMNAVEYLESGLVNGLLIGRASLDFQQIKSILQKVESLQK